MTIDGADPLSVLLAARPAFGATTEANRVVDRTEQLLSFGEINWLEVGAGDGRHLMYQLERLSRTRTIQVIALEPSPFGRPQPSNTVTWLQCKVEEYSPDRHFNWINMRHCAYYLSDPIDQITRLSAWLHQSGVFALTHWSQDCILYRLHCSICNGTPDVATTGIENLAEMLRSNPQFFVPEVEYYDTELQIDQAIADPAVALALYELARRGRICSLPGGTNSAEFIVEALRDMPNAKLRRNGVLFLSKCSN